MAFGRYLSPVVSTAHAIRAILLAMATAATFTCARSFRASAHAVIGEVRSRTRCSTVRAPWMKSLRKYRLPCFEIPINLALPPVVTCRGTNPSHAARSRPLPKLLPVPTAATSAVAIVGPMPGISISLCISASVLASALISASMAATRSLITSNSDAMSVRSRSILGERSAVPSAANLASSFWKTWRPVPTRMPRSIRKPRPWLIKRVLSDTRRSRARCRAWRSSCSSDLIATNDIVGRVAASAIASASRSSFL